MGAAAIEAREMLERCARDMREMPAIDAGTQTATDTSIGAQLGAELCRYSDSCLLWDKKQAQNKAHK